MKIEINDNYFNAIDALIDKGFQYCGTNEDGIETFEKEGEIYFYKGMSHHNTFIYHITLNPNEGI